MINNYKTKYFKYKNKYLNYKTKIISLKEISLDMLIKDIDTIDDLIKFIKKDILCKSSILYNIWTIENNTQKTINKKNLKFKNTE